MGWVIDAMEKLLPRAEACGVILGLKNHWGRAGPPKECCGSLRRSGLPGCG
jgi:hypothetical protein